DIKLTGDKNINEYSPIVLLNAIPETYSDVKAAIKYGKDSVNNETVVNGLKSKEMDLKAINLTKTSMRLILSEEGLSLEIKTLDITTEAEVGVKKQKQIRPRENTYKEDKTKETLL
ncbi:UNVERIFIED_CONTAM: hypothetical protein Sindi_0473300, partial [Sesamum indicum]